MPLDGFRILSAPISEHMGFLSFEGSTMFLNNFFFFIIFCWEGKKRSPLGKANVFVKENTLIRCSEVGNILRV